MKRFVCSLATFLLALTLVTGCACAKKEESAPKTDTPSARKKVSFVCAMEGCDKTKEADAGAPAPS
ncbi:MAG: hypothetical protein ACT4PV_04365 [Planctomycetaceae bacterium]